MLFEKTSMKFLLLRRQMKVPKTSLGKQNNIQNVNLCRKRVCAAYERWGVVYIITMIKPAEWPSWLYQSEAHWSTLGEGTSAEEPLPSDWRVGRAQPPITSC